MSDAGETVRGKLPELRIDRPVRLISWPPTPLQCIQIGESMEDKPTGYALTDTPDVKRYRLITDDTAAAVPEENPAGYDLDTCSQKHSRMAAHQAQRIDHLERIAQDMEADINRLMTFVDGQKIALRVGALEQVTRPILEAQSVGGWLHGLELQIMRFNQRLDAIERTLEDWSAGR